MSMADGDGGKKMRLIGPISGVVGTTMAATVAYGTVNVSSTAFTPVATWHMNEVAGRTMHDSDGAAHTSTGTTHAVRVGVEGDAERGYSFNGRSSYVSVPGRGLNPGLRPVRLKISLRTTKLPKAHDDWDLIRKGYYTTAGGEFKAELWHSGQASCGFRGSLGYTEFTAGPKLNDGEWHTVTCTKEVSSVTLEVDGKSYLKSVKVGSMVNSDPVMIGARPGNGYFRGRLDEASISFG
jgi:hypothetical protein